MPINVRHFHGFLTKVLKADTGQGILVSEVKNLYNDIARRENLDYVMNNNYLIILLELYCVSKQMEVNIVTSGNLKKIRGVNFKTNEAKEFASTLSNGLPAHTESQTRLAALFENWYKKEI